MPKNKQKTKTAIYHPPKKGMPYLVVTVSPEGVVAIAVESKDEARVSSNPNGLGRRPFSCYPLAQPALVWGIARLVRPGIAPLPCSHLALMSTWRASQRGYNVGHGTLS